MVCGESYWCCSNRQWKNTQSVELGRSIMKKCTKCKKVKIKERGPNLCPACLKKIDEENKK